MQRTTLAKPVFNDLLRVLIVMQIPETPSERTQQTRTFRSLKNFLNSLGRDMPQGSSREPVGYGMRQDRTPAPSLLCQLTLGQLFGRSVQPVSFPIHQFSKYFELVYALHDIVRRKTSTQETALRRLRENPDRVRPAARKASRRGFRPTTPTSPPSASLVAFANASATRAFPSDSPGDLLHQILIQMGIPPPDQNLDYAGSLSDDTNNFRIFRLVFPHVRTRP